MSALSEVLSRHIAAPPPAASLSNESIRRMCFIPELRSIDEQARTITFVASTESPDRYADVIRVGGWQLEAYRRNPVVLWAHRAGELPVGKTVEIHTEKSPKPALVHTVQFADHPFAAQVHDLYKGKFLNSVSVGFRPTEAPQRILDEAGAWSGGYEFNGTELLEISCVPIPAQPEAVARAVASGVVTKDVAAQFFSATALRAGAGGQLATKGDWDSLLVSLERLAASLARLKGRISEAEAANILTVEEFERALRGEGELGSGS